MYLKAPKTILVIASTLLLYPSYVNARSVLEGLEIVESEQYGGVEILSLAPSSPAEKAKLQVGDRIVNIGGRKIRNLDDYVQVSKKLNKSEGKKIRIEYYRDKIPHNVVLSLYPAPLQEKWGLDIVTWREAPPPGEGKPADYWLRRAKGQIRDNKRKSERDIKPEDHGRVILSLFSALEDKPDSLSTAMLVAREYGELATLYYKMGEKQKAFWCIRRALLIYNGSIRKAGDIQDLVLVENGLGELTKTMANL